MNKIHCKFNSRSSFQPCLTPNFSTFPPLLPHSRQQRDATEHGDDGPSSREVGETLAGGVSLPHMSRLTQICVAQCK